MVCNRCIKVVQDEFAKLNLDIQDIELGKVNVSPQLSEKKIEDVRKVLDNNGFELIDDKKSKLIDRIKTIIIEKIHYSESGFESINTSEYLAKELGHFHQIYMSLYQFQVNKLSDQY